MTSDAFGIVILLVEDDPLLAATLRRTLERLPGACSINVAESASEAEASWERLGPQMVLMDYRLPDGYGTDVIAKMRSNGYQTPVVCMTAETECVSEECRQALAISSVIQKPVQAEQLQSTLKMLFKAAAHTPATGSGNARRIGRFRRVRLRGPLTARNAARLLRAARDEKWIALETTPATQADMTAMRSLCAWAGWLSAQGGRLCILAQTPAIRRHFEAGAGTFVDIIDSPDTLRIQSQRLTGNAERSQLLSVIQVSSRREGMDLHDRTQ